MKWCSLFFMMFSLLSGYSMAASEKTTYGYVEKATLIDRNLTVSAKLDTGAKSASLSAINIQEFKKDDKTYMRFIVPSKEGKVEFTAEYIGRVRIKVRVGERLDPQHKAEPIKRPVVIVHIKMGDKERAIRVNLTNRKRFNYPLLLGRDAIKAFDGVVDPSLTFTLRQLKNEVK